MTGMLPLRRDARARTIPRPACPGPQPYRPQQQQQRPSWPSRRRKGRRSAGSRIGIARKPSFALTIALFTLLVFICIRAVRVRFELNSLDAPAGLETEVCNSRARLRIAAERKGKGYNLTSRPRIPAFFLLAHVWSCRYIHVI